MHHTTASDVCLSHFGGVVTRAPIGLQNYTAEPPLASGFGAVIEREYDLQIAIEESFGRVHGYYGAELHRILRHHHSRLGANIALLEQRYEALPTAFVICGFATPRFAQPAHGVQMLPGLIEQHTELLAVVEGLLGASPDGRRGELILAEVKHSHEEMKWMLTDFTKNHAMPLDSQTTGATSFPTASIPFPRSA